jgi:3'-phosphoadenosine 5'-phosphosulfate sulfotransferase (PAPS reductase)/FAD synthetase
MSVVTAPAFRGSQLQQQLWRGLLYSKKQAYGQRLQFARDGVSKMLELCDRTYLSVSFGKQSIILAHMVYQMDPDIPMYFLASSESYLLHDFVDVIDAFMSRFPIQLTIVQTNNAAIDITDDITKLQQLQPGIKWDIRQPGDPGWNWEKSRAAGHDDLQTMVSRDAYDGWFWGLAKEESYGRRMTLSYRWHGQPHPTIFRYVDEKYRCCPLMEWGIWDIAAYVATHNFPLLDTYRQSGLESRTTARITGRSAEEGAMSLKHHYELSKANLIYKRFPELRGVR